MFELQRFDGGSLPLFCCLINVHAGKSDSLGADSVDVLSRLYLFSFDRLFLECACSCRSHPRRLYVILQENL